MRNAELLAQSYAKLPGMDETNARYFMAIRTGITINILKACLDGGRKETTEEPVQILKTQVAFFVAAF